MTKHHLLEIYDVEDYNGPNPVHVTGVCVVKGPERSEYYILKPDEPISIQDRTIEQFAVRPHYDGDGIVNATDSICTVSITLTKNGTLFDCEHTYGFTDFVNWKVGKICPAHEE
jgi:hypothetical protein